MGFPGGSVSKESARSAEDAGSIPELGGSPGGGHGNPLQYSCLENPHGQRSLLGYSHKESDTTEQLKHKVKWSPGERQKEKLSYMLLMGSPGVSVVKKKKKKYSCQAGDMGSTPEVERSPGEEEKILYSCLGNPMDGEA